MTDPTHAKPASATRPTTEQQNRMNWLETTFGLGGIDLREHIILTEADGAPDPTAALELEWLNQRRRQILSAFDKKYFRNKRRRPPKENAPLVRETTEALDLGSPTRLLCAVAESLAGDSASSSDR
ncbi:hypothetical protein [Thiocystis violascens]|uniref:Uncharacterized protein n=1 Tax=Thiocystis violascens (strain ATCC 17096 / DSM 198 / 6111) TaxID=765911 RepID=I3YBE2_THIV6|nr:hypothetical protein [Thiocystis violascens]AFL74310.1 hypothetical protein Thivi_2365 [Thiocystis violascens DSM 198]